MTAAMAPAFSNRTEQRGTPDPDLSSRDDLRFAPTLTPTASVRFLDEKDTLVLRMNAAVVDVDETTLARTIHHWHDSSFGRYAKGLYSMLKEHGVEIPWDRFEQMWDEKFSAHLGLADRDVCAGMCRTAIEEFREALNQAEFDALVSKLEKSVERYFVDNFDDFVRNVSPVSDVERLLQDLRVNGIDRVACSSSPLYVVDKGLRHFPVPGEREHRAPQTFFDLFDNVIPGAQKSISGGGLFGGDIGRACDRIGATPARSVMFGDSISDVAAFGARRPGSPDEAPISVVVIRLPIPHDKADTPEVRAELQDRFMKKFERACEKTPELATSGVQVYVVPCYTQVIVEKLGKGETRATAEVKQLEGSASHADLIGEIPDIGSQLNRPAVDFGSW